MKSWSTKSISRYGVMLLALAAGLALSAAPALADSVTWIFQGVSGINGASGSITGSFSFNGSTITDWNINLPANSEFFGSPINATIIFPATTLTSATGYEYGDGANFTEFENGDGSILLYLPNGYDLGTPGTQTNVEWLEQYEAQPSNYFEAFFQGTMVGTQVTPEPSTWTLLGTGLLALLGLAWSAKRRGWTAA